ncbi:OLC1v1037448C1 [Oldenlandia corymbosa var. corymbosa]|uniref:Epidermal patterning factor-like protein n=1 Tax=Oldenlandia corymbosa var. corymbosa TaxID=529605 RepID=A0AAV1E4Z0_OLDCO|nr:OLC1v1037448C1 [Oldenlandia corymbosa var. corymbosa]
MSTPSRKCYHFSLWVAAILLFSVMAFIPSQSGTSVVGLTTSSSSSFKINDDDGDDDRGFQQVKMRLGSRPPGCVNKCMNCRPCRATLVIPPHHNKPFTTAKPAAHREDGSYYLLSWKCRCGNKLFQP